MDDQQRTKALRKIRRAANYAGARQRLSDALATLVVTLPLPLLVSLVSLGIVKVQRLDWTASRPYLLAVAAALLVSLAATVLKLARRRPKLHGAMLLDRAHGLHDRLTNALWFASRPASERTELMELAIDDGCRQAEGLAPGKAAPIRRPPMLALPVMLSLMLVALSLLEVRTLRVLAQAPTIDAVTLTADDIDFFRDSIKDMAARKHDPELQAALDRFNQLVEDIANRRLDRSDAFHRMEALDRELRSGTALDKKALEDGLRQIADELRKSDLAKGAADALREQNLAKAEKQLRDLAQRMRQRPQSMSKADLEKLRQALERASQSQKQSREALERQRQQLAEERDRLLKKRNQAADAGVNDEEERLLRRRQRELERLDRELEQQRAAERQLERLDRELAQAAADLMRDLGLSAQDLEQGAEDLNRMARQQMTEQEKEELRRRIQEMRELLRQQGQGGQPRIARLKRFSERARGASGQRGDGQSEQNGQQGNGQGQGQDGEQVFVIGPGGEKMLVLQAGQSSSSSSSQNGNSSGEPGGKQAGTGHAPNIAGKATNGQMGTQDVAAAGIDTGQGPSRAEVIAGAAERGFVGPNYKRVFTEYHTVAEQSIGKEDIPAGYRFYVQRYFQLIRPRE